MNNLDKFTHQIFCDGRIIIINADCAEVMKQIGDKEIDLVLTDPPYGIKEHGGKYREGPQARAKGLKSTNYEKRDWDNQRPDISYFEELTRISKNQIIWGGNYFADLLAPSKCWLVWHKKGSDKSDFADCELAFTSFNSAVRYFCYAWIGFGYINNPAKERKIHPTQKPSALITWCLENYSKEKDLIFDGFLGSGTTAISCIRTNRRLISCELDPIYFEKACERIEIELKQLTLF